MAQLAQLALSVVELLVQPPGVHLEAAGTKTSCSAAAGGLWAMGWRCSALD
jgi:hypothetical protein